MKIIHIVQTLEVGGLEHLVVQMAAEQIKRGTQAEIICLGEEGDLAAKARQEGIAVSSLGHGEGLSLTLVLKLRKAIKASAADIVHTHNMGPLIYGSLAGRLAGVKCIHTRHGRAPKKTWAFIWNTNEFIVAVSADAKTQMMAFNRIDEHKVRVIRNGIDGGSADCRLPSADVGVGDGSLRRARPTSEEDFSGGLRCPDRSQMPLGTAASTSEEDGLSGFRPALHSSGGATDGFQSSPVPRSFSAGGGFPEGSAFTLGTVGRLSWEKNQGLLLRAFAELKKHIEQACLVVVGDGPERSALEQQASELGIADDVQFLGYRDDVPSIMAALDVFVLPSLEEGISLTLLEAMAASRPIVATDVGGNPEVVVDGETGLLVPSGDVAALAGAIFKLHDDKELREKMGAAGRKRVEAHFSLNAMVDAYMELYEQARDLNKR